MFGGRKSDRLCEALDICAKTTPEDWERYDALSPPGDSLLGQGRFAEAEQPIVAGYEEMKTRKRESRAVVGLSCSRLPCG